MSEKWGHAPGVRRGRIAAIAASLLVAVTLSASAEGPKRAAKRPTKLTCGDPLGFQVLLDRQGFSPGLIEARLGVNTKRALSAFQSTHGLPATGVPDCASWEALGGKRGEPTTVKYIVTEADVKGPFTERIPAGLDRQAALPALLYRSVLERMSERFHVSPAQLQRMNRRATFAAGREITVPAVTAFDASAKPPRDPAAADVTIQVSREEGALRATRADGTLVFFAPVSSGTDHDPLPAGDWRVTSVDWHPVFHYNPDLFWDADPKHSKATIKAGPNNPVGVVWIGLNLEHYGLHGSPEPGRIGYSQSHGCVRLTNWDAARAATLVKVGTPVLFR